MQTETEKIKDKIAKLWKKSESAEKMGSLHEAEAFMTKAQELIQQYNLELADLKLEDEKEVNNCIVETIDTIEDHGWSKTDGPWLIDLYCRVARFYFCKGVIAGSNNNKRMRVHLVGEAHNIDMVKYVVASVVPTVKRLRLQRWKEYQGYEKQNTFKRGYYSGAVSGFYQKLYDQQQASKEKYTGLTGLIVLSERLVDEKAAEEFNLVYKKKRSLSGMGGTNAGFKDGKNLNVNKGVGGVSNRGPLKLS